VSLLANVAQNAAILARVVLDGWENSTSGLGTSGYDKTVAGRFVAQTPFTTQYLSDLFNGDALAARMCELEPKEMLRQGFNVTPGDEQDADTATMLVTSLTELGAEVALQRALVWEEVFGGGVVLLGVDDGETDPTKPLDELRLRRIHSLRAFEGSQMWPARWYPATSSKAGEVEVWGITGPGMISPMRHGQVTGSTVGMGYVHETRMLVFPGGMVTYDQRMRNNGWGRSVLAAVHDPLMDYNMSWRGVTHMLQSANQDVFYFAGLKRALEGTSEVMVEYFQSRFRQSQMRMGPNRGMTLDAANGEKFERHASQFAGVPDTIEQQALRLATARGWPATVLLERSPAGMNSTGESDLDIWYNLVAGDRKLRLEPQLKRLLRLLMLCSEGPTGGKELEGWGLSWPAFEQLSDLQQADLELKVAQKDQLYIQDQVIRPEEVAVSRFRKDGFSMATVIDLDAREAALESDESDPGPEGIPVGARVRVRPGREHMPEHVGIEGTVRIANGEAIGVEFDNAPGNIHKWYAPDELATEPDPDA
jgi:phage-related protein (TIGR01555 family)